MRFLLWGALVFSLTGFTGCGEQVTTTDPLAEGGSNSSGKPSEEDQRQLQEAKKRKVDMTPKYAQIMAINDKTAVLRITMSIAGINQVVTLSPAQLGIGDTTTIDRDFNGAQIEITLHRVGNNGVDLQKIGVEYRASRVESGRSYVASQFLLLKANQISGDATVLKRKFEYPSKTNLLQWIYD